VFTDLMTGIGIRNYMKSSTGTRRTLQSLTEFVSATKSRPAFLGLFSARFLLPSSVHAREMGINILFCPAFSLLSKI